MIEYFMQWVGLLRLIIQKGQLKISPYDYHQARSNALRNLKQFCPGPMKHANIKQEKNFKIPYAKDFIGQAAFFKQVFQRQGGHLFVPDLNVAYVRNPKAASTSFLSVMLEKLYPALSKANPSAEQINFLTDLNLHHLIMPAEKEAIFFIAVRNPFDRLVSVYRDFFERPSAHFIYDDYLFGILKKNISFPEFVDTILLIPDYLKDQHLKPQTDFLKFYKRRNVAVKILRLEDQDDLDGFLLQYNFKLSKINKNPLPVDYRQYYDSSTLEKVSQIYARDIHMLGYSQEYEALREGMRSFS